MRCVNCGFREAALLDGVVVCRKCGYTSTPADEAANANYIRVVLRRAPIGGGATPPPVDDGGAEVATDDSVRGELEGYKKDELIALADSQGIEVTSSMNKDEILDTIVKALEG